MSNISDFTGGGGPKKWVTGTTYAAGKVVWSPTDFQYFMRKTAGAGATDPASDTTNWIPTGMRAIKSIQRGVALFSATTVTVSSVVAAKSTLDLLGSDCSDPSDNAKPVRITLTNATTITSAVTTGAAKGSYSWQLTERY